ncbi:hypothetical protein ACFDAU_15680 [Sulfuriferula sp. GW1]|uniref:hypothetical protein n=1 Tax=Sulfuriferula sp. GW1 TaxID=3345111 RepID=UPI0039AEABC7
MIVIPLATLMASFQEWLLMVAARKVIWTDLLLVLCLEIFTMLGLCYRQCKLPMVYPLYIAIALARFIMPGMRDGLRAAYS